MSRLAEFRAAEEQLKAQLQLLESLKNDEALQREIEFESKLQELMSEYGQNLGDIIAILDPGYSHKPSGLVAHPETAPRRARSIKRYKHPETGEVIETKGGNHKTLKAWKAEHGADVVEGWLE
ncbi:DNA binding protein [Pseudomonas luteola]|uniref:histone-like nucleoid-structuring protein, MvaT/MvaU family n=1 Tax=Pseudomonas luteola TaxID=47886 RepID=UPI001EF41457|nr:histone-like nucleoid-structuring protein, MvaT/MvaU family [Pseudomonas luteola]MCG7375268.1 DNA binding protein [Pseudomonas luteola]